MAINHFILVLISLSCLFSFSASSPAPSPASAPFPSEIQSFNFPEPEGQKHEQELTILPVSADPSLQRICGDTDHPIECLTTTVPFLGDDVKIEPVSILKVGLEAMGNKTREALAEASLLLLDPSTQEAVASCLETCIDSYNAILDTNQKALEAIAIRDLYQLSMELSSNVENVHACSDAFEEAELESPIKEIDALLEKMISNSLAIGIDMVHF
ncbi:hypothetical protein QUC31_004963 [Theobroma cacao]|uniref:Uncharacterized protein LOC18613707 n=2 Tax=Theobroma cacao TaxID=3641 RepID=A0AB32VQ27_THECC|nr:PREDICTED: uncharacterized protein LOC18613707 [Theobroma cacao]EOX95282.1 Uncharacterized protein TCM_004824 [Theobroma cacao]WRX10840.1 Pectinesterase inhibitor domain - like 8 [Theobroma cacao]